MYSLETAGACVTLFTVLSSFVQAVWPLDKLEVNITAQYWAKIYFSLLLLATIGTLVGWMRIYVPLPVALQLGWIAEQSLQVYCTTAILEYIY